LIDRAAHNLVFVPSRNQLVDQVFAPDLFRIIQFFSGEIEHVIRQLSLA
jgi:hypothetical protein